MKRRFVGCALFAAVIGLSLAASASAQDFRKEYHTGAGGNVMIRNVSGSINVSGYEGSAVIVTAFFEGTDRDKVRVEDLSSGNTVNVRAKYERCENCSINASIRFEVQVPRSGDFAQDISTASGDIKVNNVSGRLKFRTASGDVYVSNVAGTVVAATASGEMNVKNVAGSVKASSASGNVNVEIARLDGSEALEFSSASGDVRVTLPGDLDADVSLSTVSGSVKTDFPIEVEKSTYGPGSRARGRLGAGLRKVRISSASGDVSLLRFGV